MSRRRHPEERGYYGPQDDAADEFFRQAAKAEGLSYHDWCRRYGILDAAGLRRVRRHEVATLSDASKVARSDVNRQGRYSHRLAYRVTNDTGDRNWMVDPPFRVRLPSDLPNREPHEDCAALAGVPTESEPGARPEPAVLSRPAPRKSRRCLMATLDPTPNPNRRRPLPPLLALDRLRLLVRDADTLADLRAPLGELTADERAAIERWRRS